jgi:hypothetical protein
LKHFFFLFSDDYFLILGVSSLLPPPHERDFYIETGSRIARQIISSELQPKMSETCGGNISYMYQIILKYFTHSGGRGDELVHSPVNHNVAGNKGMSFLGFLPTVARLLVFLCVRILFAHNIRLLTGSVQRRKYLLIYTQFSLPSGS